MNTGKPSQGIDFIRIRTQSDTATRPLDVAKFNLIGAKDRAEAKQPQQPDGPGTTRPYKGTPTGRDY